MSYRYLAIFLEVFMRTADGSGSHNYFLQGILEHVWDESRYRKTLQEKLIVEHHEPQFRKLNISGKPAAVWQTKVGK